jgi:hypothetical protein
VVLGELRNLMFSGGFTIQNHNYADINFAVDNGKLVRVNNPFTYISNITKNTPGHLHLSLILLLQAQ